MNPRAEILANIRASLRRGALLEDANRALEKRIARAPALVSGRATANAPELLARFSEMAKRSGATVVMVEDARELGREIARFLGQESLPRTVRMAPDPALDYIALVKQTGFSIARGGAEPSDRIGLTGALAGIAETGTLMLATGPMQPMTLALLVEAHIVVLPRAAIVGGYEEAMERFRAGGGVHVLPRAVTFVTGPSRSADIEQKIQYGAHGPRRLHIIVLEKSP